MRQASESGGAGPRRFTLPFYTLAGLGPMPQFVLAAMAGCRVEGTEASPSLLLNLIQ